jgi:hypothetical protein
MQKEKHQSIKETSCSGLMCDASGVSGLQYSQVARYSFWLVSQPELTRRRKLGVVDMPENF